MRILILGGTSEARAVAQALDAQGFDVISSLVGRVSQPRLPIGQVRIGVLAGCLVLMNSCVWRISARA